MAIVSTKGIYGLTAMVILAKENEQKLLQIKEIASKGDIPQNYLEQILVTLKKSGIVESIRGASGGYRLSKNANNITVLEILNSLESSFAQTDIKTRNSLLQPFWDDSQNKIEEIFLLTLNELDEFLQKSSENFTYYI
ncbi:Rrf2 family transcriptional regulator [Sulfurimonas sp.]|uniref:RrF2 family transcriptional regulator n=1 Tax=Sulfurimonas sp. TaxID=2022749 RepID=UPI002B48161A|nr:Rrf2 family transcriptional regulator [Sulfurimonas sp.]